MKNWKKWTPLCGFLPAVVVASCIAGSLNGYQSPVLTVEIAPDQMEQQTQAEDSTQPVGQKTTAVSKERKKSTGTAVRAVEKSTAALQVKTVSDAAAYKDGVYTGTGTGFKGTITVQVTISGGKIANIEVLSSSDDEPYFTSASALLQNIIAQQSTNVDTVSGATYSSVGLIEAVRNALQKAAVNGLSDSDLSNTSVAENVAMIRRNADAASSAETPKAEKTKDPSGYQDGTYTGTGTGFSGPITVEVVVKNGKITEISIVSTSDDEPYLTSASALLDQMIATQSTNVDTVSGATYSSVGLIEAVRDALSAAAINGGEGTAKTTGTASGRKPSSTTKKQTKTVPVTKATASVAQDPEKEGSFPYKDGTYTGTGEGFRGEVTIEVTVKNGYLTAIEVKDTEDDEEYFIKATALIANILDQQTLNVDTVSGATFSSEGILDAVSDALEHAEKKTTTTTSKSTQAATTKTASASAGTASTEETHTTAVTTTEPIPESLYQDGTYKGQATCYPDDSEDFSAYTLSVTVKIEGGVITEISDASGTGSDYDTENDWYISRAMKGTAKLSGVAAQIVEQGSTASVDAVSGATCSSDAIVKAVENALEQAIAP